MMARTASSRDLSVFRYERAHQALWLRTLDAIHVASAELFADRLGASELTFVSADARQTAVATIVSMATENVGS
jgi:hypothetical protein